LGRVRTSRVGLGKKLLREVCRSVVRCRVVRARQGDNDVGTLQFDVKVAIIRHPPILAPQKGPARPLHDPPQLAVRVAFTVAGVFWFLAYHFSAIATSAGTSSVTGAAKMMAAAKRNSRQPSGRWFGG
jgi:hypothetical protein